MVKLHTGSQYESYWISRNICNCCINLWVHMIIIEYNRIYSSTYYKKFWKLQAVLILVWWPPCLSEKPRKSESSTQSKLSLSVWKIVRTYWPPEKYVWYFFNVILDLLDIILALFVEVAFERLCFRKVVVLFLANIHVHVYSWPLVQESLHKI